MSTRAPRTVRATPKPLIEPLEVRSKVEVIALMAQASDLEAARFGEYELWQEVLEAVAAGAPNAKRLAREALGTVVMDFDRKFA